MRNDRFAVGLLLLLFLSPLWVPMWVVLVAWDIAHDLSGYVKDWVLTVEEEGE